jgi:hypothetical protein
MSNPAAYAGGQLDSKLLLNEWSSDDLFIRLLNGLLTRDEVETYLRLSGKEPDPFLRDLIFIMKGKGQTRFRSINPILKMFTNNKKSESPDYNISIYISTLWSVKKRESGGDNSDKLSKTGNTMFGNLEMSGNKITGLSSEYPPGDLNDAASWGQVGLGLINYVHKQGSMMTGPLGVGRGITIGNDAVKIIRKPLEDEDATNKEYVDSKTKPIIAVWAASHGSIVNEKHEWYFGEKNQK